MHHSAFCLSCCLLIGVLIGASRAAVQPNIIIIIADDLGYGDIGVHGCRDIPTPNIDSLAALGVRCTNAYVSAPLCSPARAGLLTGRYQQRFGHEFNTGGVRTNEEVARIGLPLDQTTLAQRLKAIGYETAMVGKWHLGEAERFHPLNRGFDSFIGFLTGPSPYFRSKGAARRQHPILLGRTRFDDYDYLTDLLGDRAAAFIRQEHQKPFFLCVAFSAVHTPMQATDAKLLQFHQIEDKNRRCYAAMLSSMDDAIGELLKALDGKKIATDTLVFFISDNGGPENANGGDNGPLRGGKGTLWEGGIRVPFIVRWGARLPAGSSFALPINQLDIFATCLAAAGAERGADLVDGVNLLPYLCGENVAMPHEFLFWRLGGQMAVRDARWKLVCAANENDGGMSDALGARLLFDMATDGGEAHDLSAQHPEIVHRLSRAWEAWNAQLVKPKWGPP